MKEDISETEANCSDSQSEQYSETDFIMPKVRARDKRKQKIEDKGARSSTRSPPSKKGRARTQGELNHVSTVQLAESQPSSQKPINISQGESSSVTTSKFFTPYPYTNLTPLYTSTESSNDSYRPPPIYVKQINNCFKLCQTLENKIGKDSFTCKSTPKEVVFHFKTPAFYRAAIHYFKANNAPYHTYQPKEKKAFRVVLRNIHPTTPESIIKAELESLGYSVRSVANIRQKGTKEPLPVFFLDLEPNNNKNKEIFTLQYLAYSKIRVEEPHVRKDIVQCIRCQEYGHSKSYCNYKVKCVKCSGNHEPKDCPHPKTTPCICALCGGNHPANYKGCLKYKELQGKQRQRRPARQSERLNPVISASDEVSISEPGTSGRNCHIKLNKPGFPLLHNAAASSVSTQDQREESTLPHQTPVSYASAARGHNRTHNVPPPTSSNDLNSLFTSLQSFFLEIKKIVTPLIPIIKSLLHTFLPVFLPS